MPPNHQMELDRALSLVRNWRQRGESVVFTNGCFDVLHRGHAWLFEQARKLGEHLIVAVNSDAYCRRVKGPTRPIQPARTRRLNVQLISGAEIILPLEADDPRTLLEAIRPEFYVLGSDYRPVGQLPGCSIAAGMLTIPGAKFCGQTVFIERIPGISTTENLRRS